MTDFPEIEKITDPQKGVIMVIGASDSGKTTLVWSVAKFLRGHFATAIVDLDMGQSRIGPPTTIGWAMMGPDVEYWTELKVRDFYFAGTVTPLGSLLPALTGASLMAERALNSAEKVIIDTTGLISEPAGRVLKHHKIDILRPDIILAVELSNELSHILDPLRFNRRPEIVKVPVPPGIRIKTQPKRAEYRYERMMNYLKGAEEISLDKDRIGIRYTRTPLRFKREFMNRIISLRNRSNQDIAIGVIKGLTEKDIKVLTPLRDANDVSSLIIGRTVIDIENRTLKDL
ncbi:MAG: Clp1/GlmU family protein [Thermodesulfovibrionales bacterium]